LVTQLSTVSLQLSAESHFYVFTFLFSVLSFEFFMTFPSLESIRQDARYALRALVRAPAFSVVAIAALAIGIGGSTAIFSVLDAVRAGALPYRDADRLVELWGNVQRAKVERRGASYPDYLDWRAQAKSFEDMAAFDSQWLTLAASDEPVRLLTESVSAPYFSVLGVTPARGRVFRADEDDAAAPAAVVVMSDGLWKRRFGADPQIVGRTLTLCCAPRQLHQAARQAANADRSAHLSNRLIDQIGPACPAWL